MEWYRKRTLGGVLDEAARRWPRREALVFESRRWSYAELNAETEDMLKVGGENVSPAEVEAYLRAMAEVRDAAVVAYPDLRLAEVPVAFVIREPGHDIAADTLLRRMQGRIASFKIPRHVVFVNAYPMTPSGKIRKVELRAEARRQLG